MIALPFEISMLSEWSLNILLTCKNINKFSMFYFVRFDNPPQIRLKIFEDFSVKFKGEI